MVIGDKMKYNANNRIRKRIFILTVVLVYLYLSYRLKVVGGYNTGYKHLGMSDLQIYIGSVLVIIFILKDFYNKWKQSKIIKKHSQKDIDKG